MIFYNRINYTKELKMLENAGHFPIEEPGISQLEEYTAAFILYLLESITFTRK